MGTRADFYIRKNNEMEWLGSIAWGGYPRGIEKDVLESTKENQYKERVQSFLKSEKSSTLPEHGWPWPWNNSLTTDYSYIFDSGKVWASCFGYKLFDPLKEETEEEEDSEEKMQNYFPDMSAIKNVQLGGHKSGIIIIGS
jgi:hypothetical protein